MLATQYCFILQIYFDSRIFALFYPTNRQALDLYTRMWSNYGPHVRVYVQLQNCNGYELWMGTPPRISIVITKNIETLNPHNSKVVWPAADDYIHT